MGSIFISYRREDAAGHAGRLCDRLTTRFGDDRVFMDIQDIRPGQDFAQSIEETMAQCDCVIAVIGPRWLATMAQRAQVPEDFVRQEIAAALARKVTVVPVLVGGAQMPAAAALPRELAALAHRQALEIRDSRFDDDVASLAGFLSQTLGIAGRPGPRPPRRGSRARWVIAPLLLLAVAGGVFLMSDRSPGSVEPPASVTTPAQPSIDGVWIAEMQKPRQPPYRIRMTFDRVGSSIVGTVEYPTGEGAIQEARLVNGELTFFTSHVPQFASEPATIRFAATVAGDRMQLVASDDAGVAKGEARRAPSVTP